MSLSSVDSDDEFKRQESNSKDDDPIGKILGNALLPSLFDHFAKRLGTTGCEGQRERINRASVRHNKNSQNWTKTMNLL